MLNQLRNRTQTVCAYADFGGTERYLSYSALSDGVVTEARHLLSLIFSSAYHGNILNLLKRLGCQSLKVPCQLLE